MNLPPTAERTSEAGVLFRLRIGRLTTVWPCFRLLLSLSPLLFAVAYDFRAFRPAFGVFFVSSSGDHSRGPSRRQFIGGSAHFVDGRAGSEESSDSSAHARILNLLPSYLKSIRGPSRPIEFLAKVSCHPRTRHPPSSVSVAAEIWTVHHIQS